MKYLEFAALFVGGFIVVVVAANIHQRTGYDMMTVATGVFIVFAAWMAFRGTRRAMIAWRAHMRSNLHQCIVCGYDLRATSARCPECGTPIPSTPPIVNAMGPPEHPFSYFTLFTIVAVGSAFAVMLHTTGNQSGH